MAWPERYRYKPGQSGNLKGRPPGFSHLSKELQTERKRNQARLIELIHKHFNMTKDEAKMRALDQTACRLEKMVISLFDQVIEQGNLAAFKYLVELGTGKPPSEDEDSFSEQDLLILNRVKELRKEKQQEEGSKIN